MLSKKKILVAPLNWGLGHASRCIPLINALLERGAEVIIAGDGEALKLLEYEFPQLESKRLPELEVKYPKKANFTLYFALRLPRLLRLIRKENQQLNRIIEIDNIDGIISDNRYGLYANKTPSVLITHQLFIQNTLFKRILNRMIRKRVHRFHQCWIPDNQDFPNLSGKLSHGKNMPKNTKYIGGLSRFSACLNEPKGNGILIVLSGPEPNRTELEKQLLAQVGKLQEKVTLVRGLIGSPHPLSSELENLEVVNYLTTKELENEIKRAKLVISRSGYSTVMDLVAMRKPALLIPTQGQVEQEYLANYLNKNGLFYSVEETKLKLAYDVEKALRFKQNFTDNDKIINQFDFLDSFLSPKGLSQQDER